jgi:phosphoribosyl-ATP pyrophosphohydrolase/phosphoribosyl-AMP cyclohydrolase
MAVDPTTIDFQKGDGLVPAIVQDATTGRVLMQGYMNEQALQKTLDTKQVTFFSRSKNRLWTKGETSGNTLALVEVKADCDQDSLLVYAHPAGPVCHKGTDTCWAEDNYPAGFLGHLESVIQSRKNADPDTSYTARLFARGMNKVAQKVGEEAVELVIEAKDDNEALFLNEAADLMYHYLVLLAAKGYELKDVLKVLEERHR